MTVEKECLAVLAQDLGPAARTFLVRVCRQQLQKEPAMLESSDIEKLAASCYAGIEHALGVPTAERVKNNLTELK